MGKINKLTKQGETVYPITVSDAVINPETKRSVTQELKRTLQATGVDSFEDFSEEMDYSAGDKVWHDDTLYEFTAEHPKGAWTGTDVRETSFKKDLDRIFSFEENPEFVYSVLDAEGKLLIGIKENGEPYFPKNETYRVESNQEFLAAWLDAAGHVLFGLRQDGSTYVAKADFLDKLAEIKRLLDENGIGDSKIAEKVGQLQSDVETLKESANTIRNDVDMLQETFSNQDNEEFSYVVTDNEGKVLFGIKVDGSPYYPNNEMYRVVQNSEWLAAWVDASDKVLFGIKTDGSIYIAKSEYIDAVKEIQARIESLSESVQPLTDTFSIVSNDEWLHAVVDAEGKLLFGIKVENGEVVMPKQDTYKVVSNDEWLAAWLDSQDRILFGVKADGTFWAAKHNFSTGGNYDEEIEDINNTLSSMQGTIKDLADKIADIDTSGIANTVFSVIDDAEERLAVTTDKDGRIISYRYKDGVLHENKGFDTPKYYQNGKEKDFVDKSEVASEVTKAAESGAVKLENVDGVSNHNTPNLLIADEMQKTFNDGTNSFTPPNAGYEMSNPIECQAGDWFTRTGTATGMVVVTDENDKNGTRLFNADGSTLGNTFQIPEDMTWVRYIRMAAEVGGATDGSIVICKGKEAFTGDNKGDYLTASKLRIEKKNLSKEVAYIKSEDGTKYYELYVDSTGTLKTKEVDPDIIPESDYPTNWIPFTLKGSFEGYFDRMCIQNNRCLIELKATGPTKIKSIGYAPNSNYGNFEHFYNNSEDRYVMLFATADEKTLSAGNRKLTIYDKDFNIVDSNIPQGDIHDFIYISDSHVIIMDYTKADVTVPGYGEFYDNYDVRIRELKKINREWTEISIFRSSDYPKLLTDGFGPYFVNNTESNYTNAHINTLGFDYDGNIILNCRNWDTWIKIRRVEKEDGTIVLGSETKNYDEAIIGRVGGRHNSGYLDSKRVLNDGFTFTDVPQSLTEVSSDDWEEWQWFHSHDVKYWGMKTIGDKQYPTYTLFDNNFWTNGEGSTTTNVENKNNNSIINPQGSGNYYLDSKDSDENYAKYQHSRVIQLSIDWENHKIMDYRVYYIPKMYSREQAGATMYDEGIISVAYSYAGEFGLWDFTTEETEVSGHVYKGAKQLFLGKYDNYKNCYRANTYKLNV